MKSKFVGVFMMMCVLFFEGHSQIESGSSLINSDAQFVIGKWVRIGSGGPLALTLKEDGTVGVDFGNDGSVDVSSKYQLSGDEITFIDEQGAMCDEPGQYHILWNDHYIAFDLEQDECGGRIKSTMGYWTKPEFKELISELDAKISAEPKAEWLLTRARIYLAVGDSQNARTDLDGYIAEIDSNPRAYLNRAATKMPADFQGVVQDCSTSIDLNAENKNAYFLRGLARYELGEQEQGCEDFEKAIQLGFSVLRIAEEQKCKKYWGIGE
jgi:hypothetical protein